MAKTLENTFSSSSKNNENESNDYQKGGSSQHLQENKRRSRSYKKRHSKRSPNNSPTNDQLRSLSCGSIVRSYPMVPLLPVPAVAAYYRGQNLSYPVTIPDWNIAAMQLPNLYTFQPISVLNPRILPPVCPYPGGYTYFPPAIAPILHAPVIIDDLSSAEYYQNVYTQDIMPSECDTYHTDLEYMENLVSYEIEDSGTDSIKPIDHMDFYLSLPRELFPSAMMLCLDPNPIIDEFCKYSGVLEHASWIMDLEFGVPREATTRPIATYDVKFNSIHCKNTPNAIHPGFEKCDQEFKNVLTFYYDCVISTWYKGYIILNQDKSVENFQSWLCRPMHEFGMCWP